MVKERNPILVILFTMITCGIYALYWYFATSKELNEKGALETSAGMMLLYMFIPILNFIAMWKYAKAIEALSKGEKGAGMLFVIALVFAPAFFYMAQSEAEQARRCRLIAGSACRAPHCRLPADPGQPRPAIRPVRPPRDPPHPAASLDTPVEGAVTAGEIPTDARSRTG